MFDIISSHKRNKVMRSILKFHRDKSVKKYENMINLYLVAQDLNMEYDELLIIVDTLEALNYLEYIPGKNLQDFVALKEAGRCYFELKSDQFHKFIRNSILTPITVSILTTATLYWLSNLLPHLLKLAQQFLCF